MTTSDGRPDRHSVAVPDMLATALTDCDEYRLMQPHGEALVVNQPRLVSEVLVTEAQRYSKGPLQESMFSALLGRSVSMVEGKEHRALRRLLSPLFTRESARRSLPTILSVFHAHRRQWSGAEPVNLFAVLNELSVRTVGATLIDEPDLWGEGEFCEARCRLWARMNELATTTSDATATAGTDHAIRVDRDIETIRSKVGSMFERRLRNPRGDTLTALTSLALAGHITREAVIDQIIALMMAAHETNAGALYWSLVGLSRDGHWASRAVAQADAVLGERRPAPTDIDALTVIRAVALEALRLYPPAARQFRVTTADGILGDQPLSSGSAVFISHLALHRRTSLYSEPQQFNPDRWLSGPSPGPDAFIPFGRGRHRCLGRHYAEFELVTLLALITQHYEVELSGANDKLALAIALRPAEPTWASLIAR